MVLYNSIFQWFFDLVIFSFKTNCCTRASESFFIVGLVVYSFSVFLRPKVGRGDHHLEINKKVPKKKQQQQQQQLLYKKKKKKKKKRRDTDDSAAGSLMFFFFSTVAVRITLAPFMSADWTFFFFFFFLVLPSFSWPFSFSLSTLGLIIVIIILEKKKKKRKEDLLHGASPSGCRDPLGSFFFS